CPIQVRLRKKIFHCLLVGNFVSQQESKQRVARKPAQLCSCFICAKGGYRKEAANPVLLHGWDDAAHCRRTDPSVTPRPASQGRKNDIVSAHSSRDRNRVEH